MSYPLHRQGRPEPRVYSVAEVCHTVRLGLEERFKEITVEGEVSGCKRYPSGHVYFTLRDGQEDACVQAVMFANDAARLRIALADAMRVRCVGTLSLFVPRGQFQLKVRLLAPVGAGDLAAALEALKAKLEAEGLFAESRKRKLPLLPRAIGVVTSSAAAAWGDIVRTVSRRFPSRIILSPTLVQGDDAPRHIVAALERVQRVADVDVVIVGRGGGSVEDLWAFNDESVARAIAACRVPVISAVGHERDVTIADLVADLRAATPTAAGEHVVPAREEALDRLSSWTSRLERACKVALRGARADLAELKVRIEEPRELLGDLQQRLDDLGGRAERALRARQTTWRSELGRVEIRLRAAHPRTRLVSERAALLRTSQALESVTRSRLARTRAPLGTLVASLDALSPLRVLGRGYAVALHDQTGKALLDAGDTEPGDALTLVLHRGRLKARVT